MKNKKSFRGARTSYGATVLTSKIRPNRDSGPQRMSSGAPSPFVQRTSTNEPDVRGLRRGSLLHPRDALPCLRPRLQRQALGRIAARGPTSPINQSRITNRTQPIDTTQQLPGCMAADGLNTRGGLDHSWLSSSSSSRSLLRPPARPCLIPTTTRMMMHQQQGGMQWLLKWCLVGLSFSLLMVVAVPSAGAASVSTRESADLRDEVGFRDCRLLSSFTGGDLSWRWIWRIRALWKLGLGLGGVNGLIGNFEDLVLPYSLVVCRFDEDIVALHPVLTSGMWHSPMNLRVFFDESFSHFPRMQMEIFFEFESLAPSKCTTCL